VKSLVVVPVDPFEGRELDVGERLPRSFAVDLLGLVEADRGLGQTVVVRSPTDPTDGSTPASMSRLVNAKDAHCDPASV
jgi:hypothetical protein